jgi:3-oxoacyl-(acyl-carrier-protein) synthase
MPMMRITNCFFGKRTGAYLAMEKALKVSGLDKENIDYINVHGTATPNNDLSEGIAMIRIFGENNVPEFSSTKAFTGHTLAAAAELKRYILFWPFKIILFSRI